MTLLVIPARGDPHPASGGSEVPMRVLFVGQRGSEAGGAERSMQLLLSNLPASIESKVILFEDGEYANELRERGFDVEVVGLPTDLIDVHREKFSLSAALRSFGMIPRLIAAYRRLAPDVIYTNTVKAHLLGTVAARLAGFRVVMHLRDILDGRARTLLRIVGYTCTDRRIAISRAVALELALPRTIIVPNPLELDDYENLASSATARDKLGLPASVPLVGILGRINRWKGHDRFLRIAKIVAARSDAHFVIVGKAVFRDEDFVEELHKMTHDLGLADRVHFVPWLADPRLAYAALDVNCNTSRAEPFGRTIIEGAACGLPTVAFDEGGAPEAIDDGVSGRVVRAGDEQAFANAILDLLAADSSQLAAAARSHARLFDAKLHAERIAAILNDLVSSKRSIGRKPQTSVGA